MRRSLPVVRLEPVGQRHARAMYRWMRDPFVRSNVGLRRAPTLERTRAWLRRAVRDRSARAYAVVYLGVHVGNVVLDRIDAEVGTARLSIYIGESDARGRGVGGAALRRALRKAFAELRLNKVWLVVQVDNRVAIRAYRSAGFAREGRLREEFLIEGRRADVLYMGILRSEFRRSR